MPPAALVEYCYAVEEPFDSTADVGGIEVEAIEGLVTIRMMPRDHRSEEGIGRRKLSSDSLDDARYGYLINSKEKCLADSFDSVDVIEEDSNEARMIRTLAAKAMTRSDSGLGSSYSMDEAEAKYLEVLDKHMEETDPEAVSFADMDNGPDDVHPKKNQASMDDIFEHLLNSPCCECAESTVRPLKSALRYPKWTFSDVIPYQTSSPAADESIRNRSVQFNDVDIKEFKMTLGHHPSATSGPPVMLDWNTQPSSNVMKLEAYEKARQPRRSRRQLKLSLQQRHVILVKERGFSFDEVKSAWQESLQIRKQRKLTLERGLAMMKWDEVWESTCRKMNRLVDGSS